MRLRNRRSWRLPATLLLIGALVIVGLSLAASRRALAPTAIASATPAATVVLVPTPTERAPMPAPPTPSPVPTNVPTTPTRPVVTPTPEPAGATATMTARVTPTADALAPTKQEADEVVRRFLAAVDADSYEDARALTSGQATTQTDEVRGAIEREANGSTVDLRVRDLVTAPGEAQGARRPVQADYVIEAYTDTLLGSMKVREEKLSNVFMVARLPQGIRIVAIEGALLPSSP